MFCLMRSSQAIYATSMARYLSQTVKQLRPVSDLPNEVQQLFNEAKRHFNQGDYQETLRTMIRIKKEQRGHPNILRLRARTLCKLNEIGRFPGTEGTLLFPKFARPVVFEQGQSQSDMKKLTEEVFKEDFCDKATSLPEISKSLIEVLTEETNIQQSRVILSETEVERKYYKAISHYVSGEWKKAQKMFGEISEVIPEAKLKKGHTYLLQGKPDKAIDVYRSVVGDARMPSFLQPEALAGIACAFLEQGQLIEAGRAFQESCTKGNQEVTANNVMAWLVYRLPQLIFNAHREPTRPLLSFQSHKAFQDLFLGLKRPCDVSVRLDPKAELAYAQLLLDKIGKVAHKDELRQLFIAEVLSKIVGFQDFSCLSQRERIITIPSENGRVSYHIEKINLSEGVFATGLVPATKGRHSPLLIFRGTSTQLSTTGAVVSMYNNIDPEGVGKMFFENSKSKIRDWLQDVVKRTGNKTQLFGYSQGAALVAMAAAAFPTYVHNDPKYPSITLNAAASDSETVRLWNGTTTKPCLKQYLVRGDVVSRLGYELIGEIYEIQFNALSAGVNPHFILSFTQPGWCCFLVDKDKENVALSRKAISILAASDLGREVFSHFSEGYLGMALRLANKVEVILKSDQTSNFLSYMKPLQPLLFKGLTIIGEPMLGSIWNALRTFARRS